MTIRQESSAGRSLFRSDDDIIKRIRDDISSQAIEEDAVGAVNGDNLRFRSSTEYNTDTLRVYIDGILLVLGVDYVLIDSSSFMFYTAPSIGQKITIKYTPS